MQETETGLEKIENLTVEIIHTIPTYICTMNVHHSGLAVTSKDSIHSQVENLVATERTCVRIFITASSTWE